MTVCLVERYARLSYLDALARQQELAQLRRGGESPDTLILLEHPPTITLGRNATEDELLTPREELCARGVAVIETDRGGRSTYHGPGQLVGYPILDLRAYGQDLHKYLRGLEESIICALDAIGLQGRRIDGLTGVWVGENKIAAIGIKARQWITSHGFSINIDPDLSVMRRDIVACGIADHGVTSIAEERPGSAVTREVFEAILLNCLSREFGFTLKDKDEMGIMAP